MLLGIVRWLGILLVLGVAVVAAAWVFVFLVSPFGAYHKEFALDDNPLRTDDDFVLQVDDRGEFWNPELARNALEEIARDSIGKNTIVLIYVHGWHHNAAAGDADLVRFAKILGDTRVQLERDVFRESRARLTGSEAVRVRGIYVGWRGKEVIMPLDYLTFWGRKAAAERVGSGKLSEFLFRLQQIYRERNTHLSSADKRPLPFMGLVSIGHSMGAQVLHKSIGGALERELQEATSGLPNTRPAKLNKSIEGFGDLVVLINPALEASQYENIRQLSSLIDFEFTQPPVLLVISAHQDYARSVFFPLGRRVDFFFEAPFRTGAQRELWIRALGEHKPQLTHEIKSLSEELPPFNPADYQDKPDELLRTDLTNMPAFGTWELRRVASHEQPYNPFIVANADAGVTRSHTGHFEKNLRLFLSHYIAATEGKHILLSHRASEDLQPP